MRFHAAAGEHLAEIEIGVDGSVVGSVSLVVTVGIVRVESIASSHLVNMPEGGDVIHSVTEIFPVDPAVDFRCCFFLKNVVSPEFAFCFFDNPDCFRCRQSRTIEFDDVKQVTVTFQDF